MKSYSKEISSSQDRFGIANILEGRCRPYGLDNKVCYGLLKGEKSDGFRALCSIFFLLSLQLFLRPFYRLGISVCAYGQIAEIQRTCKIVPKYIKYTDLRC